MAPTEGHRPHPVAVLMAVIGLILGLLHAAVSFFWAAGGTAFLDTIGGQLEAYGRRREPVMITALWLIGLIKIVAAVLPMAAVLWPPRLRRLRVVVRVFASVQAVILIGYGGVFSVAGWLVLAGLLDLGPAADPRALRWHALVWDPWFLAWGLATLAAVVGSRRAR